MRYNLQWQARAIRPDGPSEWFPAEVPGNVQYDYGKMMGWGDINFACNVEKFRETEDYTWEYRTTLDYSVHPGEKAVFVTEGIDYRYDILIDGEKMLEHEGMFSRVELELDGVSGRVVDLLHDVGPKQPAAVDRGAHRRQQLQRRHRHGLAEADAGDVHPLDRAL